MTIEERFWVVERKASGSLWGWQDMPFFAASCQADAVVRGVQKGTSIVLHRRHEGGRVLAGTGRSLAVQD